MEEFKTYILEELTIGKGSYGIAAPAIPFNPSKHTYLRITDINDDGTLNKQGLMSVDDENASNYILKENDIVFARTGNSTGRSYFYDGADGKLVYAGFLIKFSIDKKKVNPRILKYYTHSKPYFNWVRSFDTGGTRGNINAKTYGTMPITLPSRELQDKIVSILKSLDDKIELNRRINGNLEQQAQALFKAWFVDFEPFKDGKFVDSELGRIPEGWKVGRFNNIIESTLSGDWGKERQEGNYIKKVFCLRGADIPDVKIGNKGYMPIRFILEKNFATKALTAGNLVIEISGGSPTQSTGRICRISHELLTKYNNSIVCTNFCKAIRPMVGYSSFMYYMWEKLYNEGVMFSYENGTTGIKNLDINGLTQKEPIIIPPIEVALNFEKYVDIYYNKIQKNGIESEQLSHLRDTLLPRLMSGELNVNTITE